jgi:hypothetical protein
MPNKDLVWAIEAGVYGSEGDLLRAEVRRQSFSSELVPHRALVKGPAPTVNGRSLAPGDRVLGYGTFPFARQIQLHSGWIPGAWCDPVQLDCATYFPLIGPNLLSQRYEIITGTEAVRQRDRIFDTYGSEGRVFARPTECGKAFVGRCIDRELFASALGPVRHSPGSKIVVAAPIDIRREWRLLVCGDQVITGSQYAVSGSRAVEPGYPPEVRAFAENLLRIVDWRPDPVFFLDVGETRDRLGVVEVSGFSCSWLYACDLPTTVAVVSEAAFSA